MATKYENANLKFNLVGLAQAMHAWRVEHGFTQGECDELIGTTRAWGNIERFRNKTNGQARSEYGLPEMATMENIVNLIFEDAPLSAFANLWGLE
jgi:hypothetical protein